MKKTLIVFLSIIGLIVLAALIVPVFFKGDIQKQIDKAIAENVDADVYYNSSKFHLTLFRHFPNPTVELADFGVVGHAPFQKDTLFAAAGFGVTVDLFSLFGDKITIKSIDLASPKIKVKVLKDGKANYDIAISDESKADTTASESNMKIGVDRWNITNGRIIYDDESLPYYMELDGVNHTGSGDFAQDVFDMSTSTDIAKTYIVYDGTKYLNGQHLNADVVMNMNLKNFKFTFKDNKVTVNDFPLSFNGYFAMPKEDIDMDINFASKDASIKSLYSLIPAAYTEDYKIIKAEGNMSFSGFVKGIYNEHSMPAFKVKLDAKDGKIQYPDLPVPITNINIDLLTESKDGNYDNIYVDIKKLHLDMGKNPIDAQFLLRNLTNYSMKADVKARLNLAELSTMFPMEGLDLKGIYSLDFKADGIYDSIKNIMPAIQADMSMKDGHVKTKDFPKALDDITFNAKLASSDGKMENATLDVPNFHMRIGDDQVEGRLAVQNFVDYTWDLALKGALDLQAISEVYPIEDMQYSGKLVADIISKGKYSDVEAGRYGKVPTSGTAQMTDFAFKSKDLPQGLTLSNAKVTFDPSRLDVNTITGKVGHSDFKVDGFVSNYLEYALSDNKNALLKGKMNLNSNVLDINEWMTGEPTANTEPQPADTVATEAMAVPRNLDFEFSSTIKNIYYDNLRLTNAQGLLIVRDGILDMGNLQFDLLGGTVVMNGKYDTQNPDKPSFDYKLNVKTLSIPKTFASFNTVQAFAPMAQLVEGNFSTEFNLSGLLTKELKPVYKSLDGSGMIRVAEAEVKNSQLLENITNLTKLKSSSKSITLNDVKMMASIENGRTYVKPFDIKMGDYQANVSGSVGVDGSLDYHLATEIDAGQLGQQLNSLVAKVTGKEAGSAGSKIPLNFKIGGTYDAPKIALLGSDGKTAVQEQVKTEVQQQTQAVKEQASQAAEETKEQVQQDVKKEAEKLLKDSTLMHNPDSLKKQLQKDLGKNGDSILNNLGKSGKDIQKSLNDLFGKKKDGKK